MVRVISVHHFTSQNIQTVEQPTACTIAAPHRLLLALSSHCIEVRDLQTDSEVLFTFPTVDEVVQIVHCTNGDYVATLERKVNRQNKRTNFVRVYVNWDSVATLQQSKMTNSGVSLGSSECGMVQPMRARIAGRVTPTTNQSELGSLEMIEIPIKENPSGISCCQVSGNIIIHSGNILTICTFQVKTHDISKLKFIDFEELPIIIELSFTPTDVAMCENYVACMNRDSMHMFKIIVSSYKDVIMESNPVDDCDFRFNFNQDESPIHYKKLLKEESLNLRKDKITVHLQSIVKENSAVYKSSPFTFCDKEMNAFVKLTSPMEGKSCFEINNLVQLKLKPILIESAQKQVTEEFKCLVLKPMYVDQSINKFGHQHEYNKFLKSDFRQCLNSVACMIATQQEGYLYQFCDLDSAGNVDNCISVYPFTAPVYKLLMEDYFLHALTETGLETYTLRIGHQLCRSLDVIDDVNVACPPVNDSVCLVGLRPFLGVEQILLSPDYLVLLANADSSPTHSISSNSSSNTGYWTLYNLQLPTPTLIFNDISIVANMHRFTSAQTYRHLMSEAHMILRLSLLLKKWTTMDSNVTLITTRKGNTEDCVNAYRTSCALLGDHFIMCTQEKDYMLAVPYYKMAIATPSQVLKRVKSIQEQSNNHNTKGLLYYLRTILLDIKFGPEAEKFFNSGSKQNFVEAILELFEKHKFNDLPYLILKSKILREYSTEKLINVLNSQSCRNLPDTPEKLLALVILYIQRCNMKKAQDIMEKISKEELSTILYDNWELLFETVGVTAKTKGSTTFSELAVMLMAIHPDILAEMLSVLMVDNKSLSLHKVLKIFLDYLPSSIGTDSNTASSVLQRTLELYFKKYFSKQDNLDLPIVYDRPTHEAMKLLIRSYLSQLQMLQLKEKNAMKNDNANAEESGKKENMLNADENSESQKDNQQEKFKNNQTNRTLFEDKSMKNQSNESYLFANLRLEYLDRMPPFQVEITSKLYETCIEEYVAMEICPPNDEADLVLKKLQALFCSQVVPKQVLVEANTFLSLNENLRGNLSLQSLIMNVNDAILFLIDVCPQCILQYGKDRFTKGDEWKFLIATIQRRILRLSQNPNLKRICFFHKKLLKDVLTHVATTMTFEQLLQVFPQKLTRSYAEEYESQDAPPNDEGFETRGLREDNEGEDECGDNLDILNEIQNYEPYVIICKETMHANQIKKMITATAHKLLCTLNL